MNHKELMMKSLSALLESGETLYYPFYGTLLQKNARWFGYFGVTEQFLLIALLQGSSKVISWTNRVPLNIKRVTIKRMLTPLHFKLTIDFLEGESCNIRVSKKVCGIESQEVNFKGFMDIIQNR